jgi:hypothetical protein
VARVQSEWIRQLPPYSQPLSPTHSLLFMQVESFSQPLLAWQWLFSEHSDAPHLLSPRQWLSSVQELSPSPQSVKP